MGFSLSACGGSGNKDGGPPGADAGGDAGTTDCGNGELDEGETCDDGNRLSNDGCDSDCTLTPTAFRVTSLTLDDPSIGLNGTVNGTIAGVIFSDADNTGALDLSLNLLVRPLDQTAPGNVDAQIGGGDCAYETGFVPTTCTLAEDGTPVDITLVNSTTDNCYDPDPNIVDNSFATINPVEAGDFGCFRAEPGDFDLVLGSLLVPLKGAVIAAQYDADPATEIASSISRASFSDSIAPCRLRK